MNPFRRETSRWRCTTTRACESSTKSWRSVALDESMRSMRETKLYQHYTIVTLGAVHASCNEFKSCKDTRKRSARCESFRPQDSFTPTLRRRLLHDKLDVVRPASGRNTRGVVDHLFELAIETITVEYGIPPSTHDGIVGRKRRLVVLPVVPSTYQEPHILRLQHGGWELALLHVTPRVKLSLIHI